MKVITIMLFSAILFTAGVSFAQPPPLPNTFSGTVIFKNASDQFDAPTGTLIEASIDNVTKGSTTVIKAGKYSIDISGSYDDDGKNITFRANKLTAEQKAVFDASSPPPRALNLVINLSVNTAPLALASTNHTINNIGSKAFLNASASYDPDGYITAYNWSFGDGTAGSGSIVSHIYSTYNWNGTAYLPFNAILAITDNDGATNSTILKLKVYIAGDANGDGKVNILDMAKIGLSWNSKYGDAKYDDGADLNNDDKVNILDMAIVGLNWNKKI